MADTTAAAAQTGTRVTGRIVEIIGPTISVEFPEGHLPAIFNAIEVFHPQGGQKIVSEVAQHLGNNIVKCVCMDNTDGLMRGMEATDTGGPITIPVGNPCLGRIFNVLGDPIQQNPGDLRLLGCTAYPVDGPPVHIDRERYQAHKQHGNR